MSLFPTPSIRVRIPCRPGVFVETERGFIFATTDIVAGSPLEQGAQIPLAGMLEMFELLLNGVRVGYILRSSFTVVNGGGYLLTYLRGKGLADAHEVLLKLDNLVIYNFPNRGTLAVSPEVGTSIAQILESQ